MLEFVSTSREAGAFAGMALIALLLMVKTDRQFVALLEGKCDRLGLDPDRAGAEYRKSKRWSSWLLFVAGMLGIAGAVVLFVGGNPLYLGAAAGGVILAVAGFWGRAKAFHAADKALDRPADAGGEPLGGN